MPTHLQHHRHAGRGPCSPRLLALGLCLTAGLALSACGPSHKGQLTVEPAGASAEASTSSSDTPSSTPSPTPSESPSSTPSTAATWSRPSFTVTNEDCSVWSSSSDRIQKSDNPDITLDEYVVNSNQDCFGYIATDINERYFITRNVIGDKELSDIAIRHQPKLFSDYQITQGPTAVEAVRDDSGTFPGYEAAFSTTATISDTPTPIDGYRFNRRVGERGIGVEVMLICPQGTLIGMDQWHTILAGIRVQGIDAGAM